MTEGVDTAADVAIRPPAGTLRVLQVLTHDQRRGAELSAMLIRAELESRGHDCRTLALIPALGPSLGVKALGRRWRLSPLVLWGIRRAARDADVVIAHGSTTLPACALALWAHRTPFVYANIGDPAYWANTRWKRFWVSRMLRRSAAVAARSSSAASALTEHLGVPAQRCHVVPNGRDVNHFTPSTQDQRAAARAAFDLVDAGDVALVLGALAEEKRVDVALRAAALVPDLHLLIVGSGPLEADLRLLAEQLIPHRCTFIDQLSDVRPVLASADVVLLTSDTEGLPGALIEAGLCGLPVVATDVGFVADIVQDGITGLLVSAGNPAAAADALRVALANRIGLGLAAREACAHSFDSGSIADRWIAVLTPVIDTE